MWGAPLRARLLRARRTARHAELRTVRPSPEQPGRVVGYSAADWRAPGPPRCTRPTPRAQHRRGGARFTGRRSGPHLPSAQRVPPRGAARPGGLGAVQDLPDLNRVIEQHATEDGRELLRRLEGMTTLEAVIRLFRTDMDNLASRPWKRCCRCPRCSTSSTTSSWAPGTHSAGAARAGRARLGDRRGRHRRTGTPVLLRWRAGHLPPGHVQRAHAAAPDVGADDVALAHRPVRRAAPRRAHRADRGRPCSTR